MDGIVRPGMFLAVQGRERKRDLCLKIVSTLGAGHQDLSLAEYSLTRDEVGVLDVMREPMDLGMVETCLF